MGAFVPSFGSAPAAQPQFGGSNQYMNFPQMQSSNMSSSYGAVPPSGGLNYPGYTGNVAGGWAKLPGQANTVPTVDPGFTSDWFNMLGSQMGQGVQPFNLQSFLPSTGGETAPGQLAAPLNPILQSLEQFYQTGQGGPLPGVLPMWTSEMQSMQIPIEQQLANIKEQFGSMGALGSSEMASAMGTYGAQTAKEQEALLGQLTLQALPGMAQFGGGLQAEDQASINATLQEFIRTQPQYNPMLQYESQAALTFPPIYGRQGFGASFANAMGSDLAQLLTGGGSYSSPGGGAQITF